MANRRYNQFMHSFEKQPVKLMGSFTQSDLGAASTLTTQGVTLTANEWGPDGDDISIAFTAGATAGSEVVTVVGTAISVQIEDGVSTVTQVRTAINASGEAAALVTATGTDSATLSAAAADNLENGDLTDFTTLAAMGITSLVQITDGTYQVTLDDKYTALLGVSITVQAGTAADLAAQLDSEDVDGAKTIDFRIQAGATPTNLSNTDRLYIELTLRNSAN